MTALTGLTTDERTARMVLSMIAEPNDPATGRLLAQLGAVETIRLIEAGVGTDIVMPLKRESRGPLGRGRARCMVLVDEGCLLWDCLHAHQRRSAFQLVVRL